MKKILGLTIFLALLLSLVYLIFPYFVLKNQPIDQKVIKTIEETIGGSFSYKDYYISYFPYLEIHFTKPIYLSPKSQSLKLQAGSIDIKIARWSFFLKAPRISSLEVKNADLSYSAPEVFQIDPIVLQNVLLKVGAVVPSKPIDIKLSGASNDVQDVLQMTGSFNFSSFNDWKLQDVGFNTLFKLKPIAFESFNRLSQQIFHVETMEGSIGGEFSAIKKPGDRWVEIKGTGNADQIIYSLKKNPKEKSPPFNAPINFYFEWNSETEVLKVNQLNIQTPVGFLDFNGRILWATQELQESRLLLSKIVLESIPQYFIRLKELIPLNIGFSGHSDLELSLSGVWDHLSIDANLNLTDALLTYARYFSKPKAVPFNIIFDFLLKDGKILQGDFSAHLNDSVAKGTATDFNLRDLSGQINLLTNKFSIKGWETFLPPFAEYKVSGLVKVLANLKGDFKNLEQLEMTTNVSIDDAAIQLSDVHEMTNINMKMDINPGSLQVQEFTAMVDKSDLNMELSIYGSKQDQAVDLMVSSKALELFHTYEVLAVFAQAWLTEDQKRNIEKMGVWIPELSPDRQVLDTFVLNLKHKEKTWALDELSFKAYGGEFKFDGSLKNDDQGKNYQLNTSVQKVSLANFMKRGGNDVHLIEGNIFLKMGIIGMYSDDETWLEKMQGSGSLLITNGEIYTLDVVDTLAEISDQIKTLTPNKKGSPFHDLRADFTLQNKKFSTENLTLIYKDYNVDGRGDVSLDGFLNFGIETFVSPELAGIKVTQNESQRLIRPIGPFLMFLSGPFFEPELRVGPAVTAVAISEQITRSKQSGFNNFMTEEQFLSGATS